MNVAAVLYALGKLMQVMGGFLLAPLAIALWDGRVQGLPRLFAAADASGLLVAAVFGLAVGTLLAALFRRGRGRQGLREGYAIVTIGWLTLTFVAALPLFLYFWRVGMPDGSVSGLRAFTDAYFEIMSGFSTTGATILSNIEAVPRSLLFLRSLTHWLGGMGIITLAIVIFPAMGVSAYSMYRGEVPGPSHDKLRPRLAQTAQVLWGVYVLLTALQTVLLIFGGMTWFDAVNHSFATMATGGFSTRNASVAAYNSPYIEWVIIVFMYLAGVNFLLHFKALRGDLRSLTHNSEFIFYSAVIALAALAATIVLYLQGLEPMAEAARSFRAHPPTETAFLERYLTEQSRLEGLADCFRAALFQVVSVTTTTGFSTADFDMWPDFVRFLLMVLMFFGSMAGSTGGGIKMIRVMVVAKAAANVVRKLTQPRLVAPVKVGGQPLDNDKIISIAALFVFFTGLFVLTSMLLMLFIPDMITAASASIATIGNVGPGLAGVGAVENYGWIPAPAKWLLVLSMLLGRLEIFTVLIVLRPAIWRK